MQLLHLARDAAHSAEASSTRSSAYAPIGVIFNGGRVGVVPQAAATSTAGASDNGDDAENEVEDAADDDSSSSSSSSSSSTTNSASAPEEDDATTTEDAHGDEDRPQGNNHHNPVTSAGADRGGAPAQPSKSNRSAVVNSTATTSVSPPNLLPPPPHKVRKIPKSRNTLTPQQRYRQVLRHVESIPSVALRLPVDSHANTAAPSPPPPQSSRCLRLPIAVLPEEYRRRGGDVDTLTSSLVQTVLDDVAVPLHNGKTVVLLWVRSGRLAAATFVRDKCIDHKTSTRYTVRKGQGKAQSSHDANKAAQSIGSQLRRAGERALQDDVAKLCGEWRDTHLTTAALIVVSCPKTMQKTIHQALQEEGGVVPSTDPRLRHVSLDLGRPTLEGLILMHTVLTTVRYGPEHEATSSQSTSAIEPLSVSPSMTGPSSNTKLAAMPPPPRPLTPTPPPPPLTPLHEAAAAGDAVRLLQLLHERSAGGAAAGTPKEDDCPSDVNLRAGEFLQTPLHLAAEASLTPAISNAATATTNVDSPSDDKNNHNVEVGAVDVPATEEDDDAAHPLSSFVPSFADCVYHLLVTGRADPTVVNAHHRPPYYLAANDKIRDAFRRARADLGEDYCDWSGAAKVGPPLTEEQLRLQKDKEAEKKRMKKARQKERKAKDKAQAEALEQQRRDDEARRKQLEDAKRVRDGLVPKANPTATNVCDFCQKVCRGKRRNQMFQRLEYAYCSSECVQQHKRELMATAAMARLGTSAK